MSWRSSCSAICTRSLTHKRAHGDRGRKAVGGQDNQSQCHHPADLPEDAADIVVLDDDVLSLPSD